jgi:predicted AlkP superfamily pyrophosphatase or phosphodiesterase
MGRDGARCGALALLLVLAGCAGPRVAPEPPQTVVLVSLDGFRADYLDRGHTPHLAALAARGVRARWLVPTFPTKTFPQHYTLVTGLYPGRHGIVANTFLDRTDGTVFRSSDSLSVRQSRWWGGEPIWVTAERQGARAFTLMWPGSEAAIGGVRPSRWKGYDGRLADSARVDTVLAWLALPPLERPRFVTLYFEEPDRSGHELGPDSPALAHALQGVDAMIGRLVAGLARLGLTAAVNIVVVSDHGLAPTSPDRVVLLEDQVDTAQVRLIESGAFITIDTRHGAHPDSVLARLRRSPHLRVYRDSLALAEWHLPAGPRVAPIVGVAEDGWLLLAGRAALARRRGRINGGDHGYDPASPSMRALFVAAGPAFQEGAVVEPFQNIHVYELLARVLGLRPAPNDGRLDSVRSLLRR